MMFIVDAYAIEGLNVFHMSLGEQLELFR